jgi:uncharacterized protein YkwD
MARAALLAALIVLVTGGAASARIVQPSLSGRPPVSEGRKAASSGARVNSAALLEEQVVGAINAQRVRHGLVPLRVNRQLVGTARGHSTSMAQHGYFEHESFDGAPFWRRIKAAYPALPGRVWRAGENLAWASPELSASETIDLWMSSPNHRKNMLTPGWREIGIGAVRALGAPGVYEGLDVTIVTADFGSR